MTSKEYDWNTT